MRTAFQSSSRLFACWLFLLVMLLGRSIAIGDEEITITIDTVNTLNGIALIEVEKGIGLTIRNNTDQPIEIARPDTLSGFRNLSFEFKNKTTGKIYVAKRIPANKARILELLGEKYVPGRDVRAIDPKTIMLENVFLGFKAESELRFYGAPDPNDMSVYTMVAHYDFKHSTDNQTLNRISSRPIDVYVYSTRYNTPSEYLLDSKPEKAIDLFKFDPGWINQRDAQKRPPLIVAAKQNQFEVIKWLLENGATVNVTSPGGFSALHATTDIEIAKLLIDHDIDVDTGFGRHTQSALQVNSHRYSDAQDNNEKLAFKAISDLLISKGAYYDLRSAILREDRKRIVEIEAEPDRIFSGSFDSALQIAASLDKYEICKFLIDEKNVAVNRLNYREFGQGEPLILGALKNTRIVRLFIDHGADVVTPYKDAVGKPTTVLHQAVRVANGDTVKLILDAGADPFAKEDPVPEDTAIFSLPLDVACFAKNIAAAKAITRHQSFVFGDRQLRQQSLDRALFTCVCPGSLAHAEDREAFVEFVLNSGANAKAVDGQGHSAIDYLAGSFHPTDANKNRYLQTLINMVRQHGGNLNIFSAAAIGDQQTLKKLLDAKPKSSAAYSYQGEPALFMAARLGRKSVARLLIDAGFDLNEHAKDERTGSDGDTALHQAVYFQRTGIVRMLAEAGADANATNVSQSTPLHLAVYQDNIEIVEQLLKHGASPSTADQDGVTPIQIATESNQLNAARITALMLEYQSPVTSGDDSDDGLELSLRFKSEQDGTAVLELEKPFELVITNQSKKPNCLPHPFSNVGYSNFEIEFEDSERGASYRTHRSEAYDDRELNAIRQMDQDTELITIPPRDKLVIEINLSDQGKRGDGWYLLPNPNPLLQYRVVATYSYRPKDAEGNLLKSRTLSSRSIEVIVQSDRINPVQNVIMQGNTERVLELLKVNPKWIDQPDEDGFTPLFVAVREDQKLVVEWLLENGANVNAPLRKYHLFPLHVAANVEMIKLLLSHGAVINSGRETPLQRACKKFAEARNEQTKTKWQLVCDFLIERGAVYDLYSAVRRADMQRVVDLCDCDDEVEFSSINQSLRIAAGLGHLTICRYLIEEQQADVNQFKEGGGFPVLMECLSHPKVVNLLIDNGADLETRLTWRGGGSGVSVVGDDATLLHYAVSGNQSETTKFLIEAGIDIFATDENSFEEGVRSQTALEIASILVALKTHRSS